MPRGYLKRRAAAMGRKRARGGHSHQAMFSRTPGWVRRERQWTESFKKKSRDNHIFIVEHFSDFCDEFEFYDEDTPSGSEWSGADSVGSETESDSKTQQIGSHQDEQRVSDVTRSQSTSEEDEALDSFDVETGLEDSASLCATQDRNEESLGEYSLCGGSNTIGDEESFSLCEQSFVGASGSGSCVLIDNDFESVVSNSMSTLWEFVDDAISRADGVSVAPLRSNITMNESNADSVLVAELTKDAVGPLGSIIKATESDVESVVSELPEPLAHNETSQIASASGTARQCAICLENKTSTQRFMNKCNHPPACKDCLRIHYLKHQMQDISNFPLKCFWPGCNGGVRDVQVRKLVQSHREMSHYYAQASRARTTRREELKLEREMTRIAALQNKRIYYFKVLQQCSACPETQPVFPSQQNSFTCRQCGMDGVIDIMPKDEIRDLVHAMGDYLVNCPACEVLIVKDGGCDHMTCVCRHEFNFSEEVERVVGKWALGSCLHQPR